MSKQKGDESAFGVAAGSPSNFHDMSYKSETLFSTSEDGRMVYSLRHVGWRKGQPVMTNDIAVTIDAQHLPEDVRRAIARTIQLTLNANYSLLG